MVALLYVDRSLEKNALGEKYFLHVFRWMCSIIALVTTFSAIRSVVALIGANPRLFFLPFRVPVLFNIFI
jgi:hypothetical protein